MSDAELIQAWRTGHAWAVTRLVERWRQPLYGYLLRFTGQPADAEDLFQDTWVRLLAALPRYEERQQFKSLLFTVATRLAIDHARARGRWRGLHEEEGPVPLEERAGAGLESCPEWVLAGRQRTELLRQAIEQLPDAQRSVVLLRLEAGMSFQEIAEAQGAPLGTVLPRMHRAVKNIRRYFKERGHEQA
ncbi:MAG: sigma-70 family RNA polymerase sigma factor [bacterium]|jgi:RNA polymerase sigma-70 factor (ECF subfamily)|nr:sigma-70 family RNA polymerase sigma factor [bacterium]